MRRITRRQWLAGSLRCAVAAAAVAPGLTACNRVGRTRTKAHESSVTILYPYDETVLGPDMDMPAKFLVFSPLFTWNSRGEMEGRLAEHWEHSPDFRTCTVRLCQGIRWHDGAPVTAHDVKFTLDIQSQSAGYLDLPFSVNVLDDLTYSITYHWQSWEGVFDDWKVCLPKHIVEKFDPKRFGSWDFWTHPVGNGPYRHHRTVPKTMIELRANPGYYRGKPKIERVVLKLAGDTKATGIPELLSGGVDAVPYLNRADVLALAGDPRFRAYSHLYNDLVNVLFWNHRNELFRDPNVRRALTLGINRHELLQVLNFPADTPVLDSLLSNRQMRRRDFPEAIPYDPVLAGQLLDAAGWQTRNKEGLLERNGRPFTFTALVGSGPDPSATVYVQAQLKRLGVKMNLDTRSGASQRVLTGDYEAAFNRMFTDWTPDTGAYGNGAPRFLHAAGYQSPQFAELANQFRATFDPDEEDRLYQELAKLFRQDLPATFLYPDVYTTIASARIRGLENAPYPGDLTWCMDQLWLEGQS